MQRCIAAGDEERNLLKIRVQEVENELAKEAQQQRNLHLEQEGEVEALKAAAASTEEQRLVLAHRISTSEIAPEHASSCKC